MICLVIGSIGIISIGFSNNYWLTLGLYFVAGCVIPYMDFAAIILNEIGDDNYRVLGMGVMQISWALMELIFVGVAFLVSS